MMITIMYLEGLTNSFVLLLLCLLLDKLTDVKAGTNVGIMNVNFFTKEGKPVAYKDAMSLNYNFLRVFLKQENKIIHSMLLSKERGIISDNYQESVVTKYRTVMHDPVKVRRKCYYSGSLHQQNVSFAIVNFCNGFSGRLLNAGKEYLLKPVSNSGDAIIQVTAVKSLPDEEYHCPVDANFSRMFRDDFKGADGFVQQRKYKRDESSKIYANSEDKTPVVQLYISVASDVYNAFGNVDRTTQAVTEIVISASKLFSKERIFLAVVKLEIWKTDPYPLPKGQSSGDFFRKATKIFRKFILPRKDVPVYDAWVLIVRQTLGPKKGVLGLAPMGLMCNLWNGALFVRYTESLEKTSIVLAHELGHMLNLGHVEDLPCKTCSFFTCIMSGRFAAESSSEWDWDTCSKDRLTEDLPKYFCLFNDFHLETTMCGNGILEADEECDCGEIPDNYCNQQCCNEECLLRTGSQCASGLCCLISSCQFRASGAICRGSKGECDKADRCNGRDATCVDRKAQDGVMCTGRFFCYNGECVTHDMNCQKLWGKNSKTGANQCYDKNKEGDLQGHCSKPPSSNDVTPCSDEDKLCGLLQCDVSPENFPKLNLIYPDFNFIDHFFYTEIDADNNSDDSSFCSVAVPNSLDLDNVCYAPDGVKCATNKMCFRRKCLDRAWFIYNKHLEVQFESKSMMLRVHLFGVYLLNFWLLQILFTDLD